MMDFGNEEKGEERIEIRKVEYKDEKGIKEKGTGKDKKFSENNTMAEDKQDGKRGRQKWNHADRIIRPVHVQRCGKHYEKRRKRKYLKEEATFAESISRIQEAM